MSVYRQNVWSAAVLEMVWCGGSFRVMVGWVARLGRVADSYQPHWNSGYVCIVICIPRHCVCVLYVLFMGFVIIPCPL